MPADDCLRLHNNQRIRPSRPKLPQRGPEQTIKAVQCRSRSFAFEHSDLVAQREDLKRSIYGAAKKNADDGEDRVVVAARVRESRAVFE